MSKYGTIQLRKERYNRFYYDGDGVKHFTSSTNRVLWRLINSLSVYSSSKPYRNTFDFKKTTISMPVFKIITARNWKEISIESRDKSSR